MNRVSILVENGNPMVILPIGTRRIPESAEGFGDSSPGAPSLEPQISARARIGWPLPPMELVRTKRIVEFMEPPKLHNNSETQKW